MITTAAYTVPTPPTLDYRIKKRGGNIYLVPPVGKGFTKETRTALRDWLRDAGYFSNIIKDHEVSASETSSSPPLDAIIDGVEEQRIGREVQRTMERDAKKTTVTIKAGA